MSKKTLITSRDPKGLHAINLFEVAYNKAKLDDARAQRLNECGGELQDGIAKLIAELSTSNRYADEEVRSNCKYPEEYKWPKAITDQIKTIAEIFDLDPNQALEFAKTLPALPEGAEGWFAIPSVKAIAKRHFPKVIGQAKMYCYAVKLVHTKIADSRSLCNYSDGRITPGHLQVHARTAHAMDRIAETQEASDILIVAAQLGMHHRGKSVRRAREVFVANEFGLGSLAVGSIVLTHPERLVHRKELGMDCSGDEFSLEADGVFSNSPCLCFGGNNIIFGTRVVNDPRDVLGSVSGFLP